MTVGTTAEVAKDSSRDEESLCRPHFCPGPCVSVFKVSCCFPTLRIHCSCRRLRRPPRRCLNRPAPWKTRRPSTHSLSLSSFSMRPPEFLIQVQELIVAALTPLTGRRLGSDVRSSSGGLFFQPTCGDSFVSTQEDGTDSRRLGARGSHGSRLYA